MRFVPNFIARRSLNVFGYYMMEKVNPVSIDNSGRFKYILIKVQDKSGAETFIVRGNGNCQWHSDIFELTEKEPALKSLSLECVGGGRIEHHPAEKAIKIYGHSTGYGLADHAKSSELIKKSYPDYTVTWSNDVRFSRGRPIVFEPDASLTPSLRLPPRQISYDGKNFVPAVRPPERLQEALCKVVAAGYDRKLLREAASRFGRQLAERHLPPEVDDIRTKARAIEGDLLKSGIISMPLDDMGDFELEEHQRQVERKVTKRLKSVLRHHNQIAPYDTAGKCLTYAAARTAGDFACVRRVLAELQSDPDFVPSSVLDMGSGIGSVFWACDEIWGKSVNEYYLIDASNTMMDFAQTLLRGGSLDGRLPRKNVFYRQFVPPDPELKFDLVVCAHSLLEMGGYEQRMRMVDDLWLKTNKYLVLIDNGTFDGYRAVLEARDRVLRASVEVDWKQLNTDLSKQGVSMSSELIDLKYSMRKILRKEGCSERYNEKLAELTKILPSGVAVELLLPVGHVYAPCSHDFGCPRSLDARWKPCAFQVKHYPFRSVATHPKQLERANFSYVILRKGPRSQHRWPRIVKLSSKKGNLVYMEVCTKDGVLLDCYSTSFKSGKAVFNLAKQMRLGQLLPMDIDLPSLQVNDVSCDAGEEVEKAVEKEIA